VIFRSHGAPGEHDRRPEQGRHRPSRFATSITVDQGAAVHRGGTSHPTLSRPPLQAGVS